jgi:hypothetical protein
MLAAVSSKSVVAIEPADGLIADRFKRNLINRNSRARKKAVPGVLLSKQKLVSKRLGSLTDARLQRSGEPYIPCGHTIGAEAKLT